MKHKCKVTDDTGKHCDAVVDDYQWEQDGMCSRCADLLWDHFVKPVWNNKEPKPILFQEDKNGTT